jgi:tetratricopeptide (TPR) repeat protein
MKPGVVLLLVLVALCPALVSAQGSTADLLQARQLYEQKKYGEAAAILERVDAAGRAAPADLLLLGMCNTALGLYDKAGQALDKAAIMEPNSAPLMAARANIAFMQKRFSDAYRLFSAAHDRDPSSATALAGMVASEVNAGVELFSKGEVEKARAAFHHAMELEPRSIAALRNIGVLELQLGFPEKAADALEKALALAPEDPQLLRFAFIARSRLGDISAELAILDRLIAVQPADPETWAAKGKLLASQGRTTEATQAFQKAVEKGSQDPQPYLALGSFQRNRFLLHDAIARAVQLAGALQLEAVQAAQKVRGKDDLKGLNLITTQVSEVRATLGSAVTLLREIDGDALFMEDLGRLQSWFPGSVELRIALARYHAEKAQWKEALAAWQGLLRDHPLEAEAQRGAGLAQENLGQRDQAILSYLRALDLEPTVAELYGSLDRLYANDPDGLRQLLLDRSFRDTRNALLFRELAKAEAALGLASDVEAHNARAAQIESGK